MKTAAIAFIAAVLAVAALIIGFMWLLGGTSEDVAIVREEALTCTDGTMLNVTYLEDEHVIVELDGVPYELTPAVSASGARYANTDESFVFWNRGAESMVLVDGEIVYEGCRAEDAATERYTTEAIANGYALSFVPPAGATVSLERDTFYKVLYAGPQNEYPALTDGFTVTMTILAKDPAASLQSFVEGERDSIRTAVDAPITEATINNREALSFDYQTELGTQASNAYVRIDDETAAVITTSIVNGDTARYERMISDMIATLTFEVVGVSNEDDVSDLIRLTNLEAGDVIESPLVLEGEARGPWYFEATFPIVLTNWDGEIIAEGFATAEGEWMTEEFVPFSATIEFESPYSEGDSEFMKRGSLILQKSNPSGLPENDAALELSVRFAE